MEEDKNEKRDEQNIPQLPEKAARITASAEGADSMTLELELHIPTVIKALEENGVGRPSTYAATIETLKAREYAKTEKKKLVPMERGLLVCDWLVKKMDALFSVGYTAQMEAELDKVEEQGEPMNTMLSEFYGKFIHDIGTIVEEERPDPSKFEAVFAILADVKDWKPAKTVGKRTYDDKAFVASVKEQAAEGKRPLSARQLQFLVRMAVMYADQIPDCENRLKEAGLGAAKPAVERADPELVAFCFEALDRIGGMEKNPFLKSLREQNDRGKMLSMKQFQILARSVGENAGALDDCDAIREKLSGFVPGGFEPSAESSNPAIPKILKLMESVTEWRPAMKKGKRLYDDKEFIKSLNEQYARRHALSQRQEAALRRVVLLYKAKIPGFAEQAADLGFKLDNAAAT